MERGAEEEGRRADKIERRCEARSRVPRDGSLGRDKESLGTAGRARGRAALRRPTGRREAIEARKALGGNPPRAYGLVRHFEEVADVGFAERRVVVVDEIAHGVVALGVEARKLGVARVCGTLGGAHGSADAGNEAAAREDGRGGCRATRGARGVALSPHKPIALSPSCATDG